MKNTFPITLRKTLFLAGALWVGGSLYADTRITLFPDQATDTIPAEIYGQFAEHLGCCIYGGIWVGEDSPIPNTQGYRNDVLAALQNLHIPVLRWPGGCFADDYYWRDGIGPRSQRPRMVNTYWGGTTEDNSFGTHEFLNLCELLGCEPYVSMNVGSGTPREAAEWVEYMTSNDDAPMANLRRQNGRDKAWNVHYIGIGNESWGCGGQMRPEYYADLYRRYAEYTRSFSGNTLYKIASGASDYDYHWTEVMMQRVGQRMNGLSLHYYTVLGWEGSKGSATQFDEDGYWWTLGKCLGIEPVLKRHCDIMDEYDPQRRVRLLVDEWGTWFDEEPGTIPGHLFQQNTMRDAMVAALSLNTFHRYIYRVGMTNIAQVVNVLQAMILTRGDSMLLTPTYHVFDLYKVHRNALSIPLLTETAEMCAASGANAAVPQVSATASRDRNGQLHISLANTSPNKAEQVEIDLSGIPADKQHLSARILHADTPQAHNTFDHPENLSLCDFRDMHIRNGKLLVTLPKLSIVTIAL